MKLALAIERWRLARQHEVEGSSTIAEVYFHTGRLAGGKRPAGWAPHGPLARMSMRAMLAAAAALSAAGL